MIQNIRKISILNKIFNVNGGQWSKISFSWTINFLYRAAFVICWTMILTVFVGRFGISYLPHLFVINAFFTVLGSIFYSVFIDQFKKEHILAVTVVIAIFITAVANSFARENVILFLALLLVVISVFLNQFKIISNGYSEEMFNPVESERAFPLIETSEVVGGIAAGIAIAVFSDIPIKDFIYLFVAILIATIPCLILCENICKKELKIRKEKEFESKGILSKFKKELSSARHIKFIKGLFLIVLVQWILFNLLEFQYTKAIYQDISGLILDSGSGFEHAFAHELGAMFVLFNVFALVVQIFLGSRFITSLGVIGSMLIHPIITFFSLFGLMFSFGFSSAVFAKNNFTITTTIYTNSYHSAYYAVKESLREHTREFLEGIVRPIGAISGMILLIILQKIFTLDGTLIFSINVSMVLFTMVLFYVIYREQANYTDIALNDLLNSNDKKNQINAIDLLSQKGHKNYLSSFSKLLFSGKTSFPIKMKILRAFGELQDFDSIPLLIKCFDSDKIAIRERAVDVLLSYDELTCNDEYSLISNYELVKAAEKLYKSESKEEIRSKVVILISKISTVTAIDFLLRVLKESHGKLKADTIYALGNYNDPKISIFIKPYLSVKDADQRVAAAISLYKFDDYMEESNYVISSFLHSKKEKDIAFGLFALGELELKNRKKVCFSYLNSKNIEIKIQSAISLAKMGDERVIPTLLDLIFKEGDEVKQRVKKLLQNINVRISKNLDKIIKHIAEEEIKKTIEENENKSLQELDRGTLVNLRWLYCLVDEYEEFENINYILKN